MAAPAGWGPGGAGPGRGQGRARAGPGQGQGRARAGPGQGQGRPRRAAAGQPSCRASGSSTTHATHPPGHLAKLATLRGSPCKHFLNCGPLLIPSSSHPSPPFLPSPPLSLSLLEPRCAALRREACPARPGKAKKPVNAKGQGRSDGKGDSPRRRLSPPNICRALVRIAILPMFVCK